VWWVRPSCARQLRSRIHSRRLLACRVHVTIYRPSMKPNLLLSGASPTSSNWDVVRPKSHFLSTSLQVRKFHSHLQRRPLRPTEGPNAK
jgi:hypothetical protein